MSVAQGFTFSFICVLVITPSLLPTCDAVCFFPTELQGEFVMQSTSSRMDHTDVQYSHVNITGESIPIWGLCHRRIGNNYILMDSSSGTNCIRCFHLTLKSRNVLLVSTEGLDKCYTTEEAAEATCLHALTYHKTELLLFKSKEAGGEEISKSFCPVHGKFTFVYNVDDGTEDDVECDTSVSEMDSCSSPLPASSMNLHFLRCSFKDVHNLTFHCLGDWEGPGNERYVALLNPSEGNNTKPRYRCALYHTDKSGKVYMAFSSDSTCTSKLVNSTSGYETLILTPTAEQEYPPKVLMSSCRFPAWMQGTWEHMNVNGPIITFSDHLTYRMFQIRCIGSPAASTNLFPVFIRDQCGGEAYNCIWIEKRASNVLEFQLGSYPSAVYNESLCFNSNFPNREWITQGRLDRLDESPCPITGEYTGLIPDNSGLCAKLSSDCKSKEIMYYTMSECQHKDIYEGRITKIARSKRKRESSSDEKVYHVTNPRSPPTVQIELENTSAINSAATTTLKSSDVSMISNDNDSIGTKAPIEKTRAYEQYPTTVNTPFYSLNIDGEITKNNESSLNHVNHHSTETAIESTVSNYEISSLSNSRDKEILQTTTTLKADEKVSVTEIEQSYKHYISSATESGAKNLKTEITTLRTSSSTVTPTYLNNISSLQPDLRASNRRDQDFDDFHTRRVDYTHFTTRQDYGSTTRITPITFHGSISEIPFHRGVGYPHKFQRQQPPFSATLPTQPMYNRQRNWMEHSHGNSYSQFRVRQEPGRYIEQNPYPITTVRPDIRRSWEMRIAESHPIFVSNNHKVLPIHPRAPVALPPIQLPPAHYSIPNNRRPPFTSSAATPLREERNYRCLGQWQEKGLMYTYTQRRDIGTYECFVGSIISETEIYIKEAGEHCERNVDPLHMGMKLTHKGQCTDSHLSPIPWDISSRQSTSPYGPPVTWPSTRSPHVTKPWKPITAPPRIRNEVLNNGIVFSSSNFIISLIMCLQLCMNLTSLS